MKNINKKRSLWRKNKGATLVEFVVVAPTLLFTILGAMQTGMVFYAKSNLNYAAYEAARAGSVGHADVNTIRTAFTNAMAGYYGGGRTEEELSEAVARAAADINNDSMQIELLSPTKESFDDYYSPRLAAKYGGGRRVIPNSNISAINCPPDRKSCNSNPTSNASGQTLSDANILNLRITYGIPAAKQMPLVGKFYVKALQGLQGLQDETSVLHGLSNGVKVEKDASQTTFEAGLLAAGRIPVVVHTTIRMQSDAFENGNVSSPGPGNNGTPIPSEPEGPDDGDIGSNLDGEGGAANPRDGNPISNCSGNTCCEELANEDIPADFLFSFDSAQLSEGGESYLDQVIKKANIEEYKDQFTSLTIVGHTDTIGADAYNQDLSYRRANAVKNYLQSNGFPSKPINANGRGEQAPVVTSCPTPAIPATAQDKACQSKNRRVTIRWESA